MAARSARPLWASLWRANFVALACGLTVAFRMHAVNKYGRVIHEYDPWFNFRATEYLAQHGSDAFGRWYDEQSWYPLGRPVGPTVYPALMYTARLAHALCSWAGVDISLNDICVFLPAACAVLTVLLVLCLTLESSGSASAALSAACIMAIVPAHTMRSVAGAYDNEAVAVPAIVAALWLWARALRSSSSWPYGALAGLAFGYLASAWGAYPFVSNLVALHVALLCALGRYSLGLHLAYALFWLVGTACALQLPVVGWQPLRSLEQLAPLVAFFALVPARLLETKIRARGLAPGEAIRVRLLALLACALVLAVGTSALASAGLVSPLSIRVRAMFISHARTGNPLVDSVAEHRATPVSAYAALLHLCMMLAPLGAALAVWRGTDSSLLLALYWCVALFFSSKMVRLILLLAPPAAACSGVAVAAAAEFAWAQLEAAWRAGSVDLASRGAGQSAPRRAELPVPASVESWRSELEGGVFLLSQIARTHLQVGSQAASAVLAEWRAAQAEPSAGQELSGTKAGGGGAKHAASKKKAEKLPETTRTFGRSAVVYHLQPGGELAPMRVMLALSLVVFGVPLLLNFLVHSLHISVRLSEPLIVSEVTLPDGQRVVADDYREAYWWLRDETPADSRVLAWWDYGYHINGLANRTSLADGNTWNHEHIALVGRCLLLPPAQAHELIRHLADYVLVWTTRHANGSPSDDLGKAGHIARIAASVYSDIPAKEMRMLPDGSAPTDALRSSLLFALHAHALLDDAPTHSADELAALGFEEAYTSKHRMVRIFRVLRVSAESREHVAASFDRMRACHAAEGELHPRCREEIGYPPSLASTLAGARQFT